MQKNKKQTRVDQENSYKQQQKKAVTTTDVLQSSIGARVGILFKPVLTGKV